MGVASVIYINKDVKELLIPLIKSKLDEFIEQQKIHNTNQENMSWARIEVKKNTLKTFLLKLGVVVKKEGST